MRLRDGSGVNPGSGGRIFIAARLGGTENQSLASPERVGPMSRDLRVSIIIVNYNYGRFLGAAIDSALAQTWKNIEVVVVDDGSTDNSPEIVARYGDRIKAYRKENGGQASAQNYGFERATGRLVIFLDADDLLYPDCAASVAARWRPGVSKIQYRLDTIDADGCNLDLPLPHYPPDLSPTVIKRNLLTFGRYLYAPASGNAFDRDCLDRIMPIPADFRYNSDGYLCSCAPLLGDVETIPRLLAAYRAHGRNHRAQASISGANFARRVHYDLILQRAFVAKAKTLGYDIAPRLSNTHVENRILSFRLVPAQHPEAGASVSQLIWLGIRSARTAPHLSFFGRVLWSAWFVMLGTLPLVAVKYLVSQFRLQTFRAGIARKLSRWSRR
jgi:glycosyltransferase involved in cell wall biosynthesis